jgi:hypothetical protein
MQEDGLRFAAPTIEHPVAPARLPGSLSSLFFTALCFDVFSDIPRSFVFFLLSFFSSL